MAAITDFKPGRAVAALASPKSRPRIRKGKEGLTIRCFQSSSTSRDTMRWFLSFLLLAVASIVSARSAQGDRLLVIVEDSEEQNKYTQLWADLKGEADMTYIARGFEITYEAPKSESFALVKLGELNFDHLFILPVKGKGFGPSLSPKTLLDFINKKGNVLLGLSSSTPAPAALSSFLLEFDIHTSQDRRTTVVDHFNYDTLSAAEQHDVLVLPRPAPLRADTATFFGGDGVLALPHAVPQTLGGKTGMLAPILRAPATAYSYSEKEKDEDRDETFAFGTQIALITAMQARNSARFTVFGATEALEDKWFNAQVQSAAAGSKKVGTANRAFAEAVTGWTFQELGVVRAGTVQHALAADGVAPRSVFNTSGLAGVGAAPRPESLNPTLYRIRNEVAFAVELSAWRTSGASGRWAPFAPPAGDALQLEFSMLSPFVRLPLAPRAATANSTFYGVTFETPDQHGIFSFRVAYHRPFLSAVAVKDEVTVRHFAHDEWPRSYAISAAWPWISGIAVTVAGWLVFVALWLYSEPPRGSASAAKKTQ